MPHALPLVSFRVDSVVTVAHVPWYTSHRARCAVAFHGGGSTAFAFAFAVTAAAASTVVGGHFGTLCFGFSLK